MFVCMRTSVNLCVRAPQSKLLHYMARVLPQQPVPSAGSERRSVGLAGATGVHV